MQYTFDTVIYQHSVTATFEYIPTETPICDLPLSQLNSNSDILTDEIEIISVIYLNIEIIDFIGEGGIHDLMLSAINHMLSLKSEPTYD